MAQDGRGNVHIVLHAEKARDVGRLEACTTLDVVNSSNPVGFVPGHHQIDAYGRGGFRFAGMSHRGSIIALPSGISAWPATTLDEATLLTLQPVLREQPPLEFLLVGTGLELIRLRPALRERLNAAGISVDEMATAAAARTYNILVAEGRRAGAALLAVD